MKDLLDGRIKEKFRDVLRTKDENFISFSERIYKLIREK